MSKAQRPAGGRPQPELREALQRCRTAFLGVGVFSGFINVLALTGSLYMLQVYDRVLTSRSVPTLVGLTVLMLGLYAIFGMLDILRSRVMSRIGLRIDRFLRERVFDIVLLLPLRVRQSLDALQPVRDLDQIRAFLAGPGPIAIFDIPWLPIYLAMVYLLHPWLGLLATAGAIVFILLTLLTEYRSREPAQASARNTAARQNFMEAARRNAEVIRASGLARNILGRWDKLNEKHLAAQLQATDVTGGLGAVSRVLRVILQSAILGLGAYVAIRGEATAGVIIAASILSSRALAPIEIAIANWRGFITARQSYTRLSHIMEKIPSDKTPISLPPPRNSLAVQSLWVAAPGQAQAIVQDASFTLAAGEGLGIIGPSAAGKSTLARTLVGAWAPLRGSIRIDEATLDQWHPDVLGGHIGYLPQDIELFDGTIAENIGRLDEDPPAEAVIAAAKAAGVHDMILHLADGYETRIGEGGMMLSAGQRQRIALARSLYGDPFLVVLDEPNSNLDADGDRALTTAILSVRARGGIAIVIAHRPAALAAVDKVLVFANGSVQACGAKDEILGASDPTGGGISGNLFTHHCSASHSRGSATMIGAPFDAGRKTASARGRADGIRGCLIVGGVVVLLLVGGLGAWATTWSLAGAVLAQGTVVVDSNVKKVQHPTGGIVGQILVRDGARVAEGDLLIRLDETVTRANLQVITKQLDELAIRQARLAAERDSSEALRVPANLAGRLAEPEVAAITAGEITLLESRREALAGQRAQLRERVAQLKEEIAGLTAQAGAKAREIALVHVELESVEKLWGKSLVSITKLTAMRREDARLDGERGQLVAAAAQAKGKIAEIELQIIQLDQNLRTDVIKDLREAHAKEAELLERKVAAEDQLKRIDIRAPQAGVVHQLAAHTVGGVITQSEPIMLIVPEGDALVIEAKLSPQDIDHVKIGQETYIRFPAFNQRITPEFEGRVTRISADLTKDQQNNVAYYVARISVAEKDLQKPEVMRLVPGMPAEVHIRTMERTALSYLIKPLQDQFALAFKER